MIVDRNRFGDSEIKSCKQCGRRLHPKYNKDICPACMEMNLFNEVKDYIRKNDVNESQVADHFGISNAKVRAWIRDGRIQYKNTDGKTVSQVYCQICGKPLDVGNLCSECRHLQGLEVVAERYGEEAGQMRFINKDRT